MSNKQIDSIKLAIFFLSITLLVFSFSPTCAWAAVPNGDINGDGVVNVGDVVLAQRIAMGYVSATPEQLSRGNVAPISAPDGVINAADVVVIQRISMGLISTYTITVSAGANGTISPSGTVSVLSGATVTFTIIPTTGYHVATVLEDGVSKGAITSYTFTNVTTNHTVIASFAASDTTPPTGSIVINNGVAFTNTTTVTLTLSATDSESGVSQMQFSNDGSNWSNSEAYITSKSWPLTAGDGTKTVYAKFKDNAGNWMTVPCSSSITLDITPPAVMITSPAAGNTNNRIPTLTYTVSDGTVVVKVDGIVVNKVSGNNLDILSFGTHAVRVESTDVANNTGYAEVTFTVVTASPTVTITSPVPGFTNSNMPLLIYTLNKEMATTTVKVDSNILNKISGDALDALADGMHKLRVEATDADGYQIFDEVSFTVDTEPPTHSVTLKFSKIEAGGSHATAIAFNGTLWAWGDNRVGQLGDGTTIARLTPTRMGTDTHWTAVSAGDAYTVAIKSDGSLWAWGSNYLGRLGAGMVVDPDDPDIGITVPIRIGTDSNWTVVSAGGDHTAALKSDGSIWTWGSNSIGQLGGGEFDLNKYVPTHVGPQGLISVSAGAAHTVALRFDGTIWATGADYYGQLGWRIYCYPYAQNYFGLLIDTDWAAVSAGSMHTVALKTNGTLWAWGSVTFIPTQMGTDRNWSEISASWDHTLALKSDGSLWTWGINVTDTPVRIGSDTDWVAISAGYGFSMALKSDGSLWTWGINSTGQLGDGTTEYHSTPHQVNVVIGSDNPILINNGAVSTNSAYVTLDIYAWDETSGTAFMKFSNDGTTWSVPETYATTKAWTLSPGDGEKHVYVMFQDGAGNWSSVYSSSIILDTVTPTVTITSPTAGTTNNRNPILIYTASEGTVVVKVDGSIVNKVSGNALDALTNGNHTVRVEATDMPNNTGFAEVTFTVTSLAPTVTITSPSYGTTNNRTPLLTYTVSGGTVVVTVDGGVVNKVSGNSLNTLSDGIHTVRVEATNGNGTGFDEFTFTVDTTPPTVSITSPVSGTTNLDSLPLIYSASDGSVTVKLDNSVLGAVSGDTLDALANGSHTVRVEARDAANNIGITEVTFIVDTAFTGNDDTNIYCMGTGTYLVGPSAFTNGIIVPSSNNIVLIAAPANGAIIYGPKVIIKGAMDNTVPVIGVIVQIINSSGTATYPAAVNGKYFAAQVPLAANSNTIKVIATDQNNAKHQASITVIGAMQSINVNLIASPSAGIPTLKQNGKTLLNVALSTTTAIENPVKSYAWDFNGSGANQLTCFSHSNVTASYQQTGLYLILVTVTDTAGNHFMDTVIVNVIDVTDLHNRIIPTWNGMKTALLAGNIEGALAFFTEPSRERYRQAFAEIGSANIITIFTNITEMRFKTTYGPVAEYWALRQESQGTFAYPVTFIQDESGNWKIMGF